MELWEPMLNTNRRLIRKILLFVIIALFVAARLLRRSGGSSSAKFNFTIFSLKKEKKVLLLQKILS